MISLDSIISKKNNKKSKLDKNTCSQNHKINFKNIKDCLGISGDIKYKEIIINSNLDNVKTTLFYIDGLSSSSDISNYITKPLVNKPVFSNCKSQYEVIEQIKLGEIYFASYKFCDNFNKVLDEILSGSSVLIFDEENVAAIFDTQQFDKRAVTEPTVENATKGSKDSFVETYRTNTATIRRKIKSPNLVIEEINIGRQTNTSVGIIYMGNIVNENLLKNVRERLQKINVDQILTTSIIEEYLSENKYSTFPQIVTTERPDVFCADIIEGRVGLVVDGIPFSFIVPGTMIQFMQAAEDYSRTIVVATLIRTLRFLALIISLFMPAVYIAITMYHPEMIPTNLAMFIARSREGVTFPVTVETIVMLLSFEILFEAGLRIPKTVGQAVSILGTLVVGQAAVEAKLVSPSIVVIIAMTTISAFAMPNQDFSNSIRIWRVIFTVLSSILGLIGIVIGIIFIVYELCKLEAFGVPYLSPFVSSDTQNMTKDTILRVPYEKNKERPRELKVKNKMRVGD